MAWPESIYVGWAGVVTRWRAIGGHSANLWDLNTKGISKNSGRRAEFVEAEIRNERPCHRNKRGFVANITEHGSNGEQHMDGMEENSSQSLQSLGRNYPGQVVLVLQGGGALGSYQAGV